MNLDDQYADSLLYVLLWLLWLDRLLYILDRLNWELYLLNHMQVLHVVLWYMILDWLLLYMVLVEKDFLHCCSNACYWACSCYSRVPLGKLLTSHVWKLHEVNSHPWVGGYCPEIILSSLFFSIESSFLYLSYDAWLNECSVKWRLVAHVLLPSVITGLRVMVKQTVSGPMLAGWGCFACCVRFLRLIC